MEYSISQIYITATKLRYLLTFNYKFNYIFLNKYLISGQPAWDILYTLNIK